MMSSRHHDALSIFVVVETSTKHRDDEAQGRKAAAGCVHRVVDDVDRCKMLL